MVWKSRSMWDEMQRLHEEMDSLFQDFWEPKMVLPFHGNVAKRDYRQPLADLLETDKEFVVSVELPGVNKDDIQVTAKDNGVEIKVEREDEQKEEKKGHYHWERSYSGFYRFIELPQNVDLSKIDGSYKNGILELKIPKKVVEDKSVKKIQIR